jgi:hypothetical protein
LAYALIKDAFGILAEAFPSELKSNSLFNVATAIAKLNLPDVADGALSFYPTFRIFFIGLRSGLM